MPIVHMAMVGRALAAATLLFTGMAGVPADLGATRVQPIVLAVIGDTPYGADQTSPTAFPRLVTAVNADPAVSTVMHLGDFKNGSSRCSRAYFWSVQAQFNSFADPLVFTPGDNDWTDCHKAAAGAYVPTERLARLREIFYPSPGWTLGRNPIQVVPQSLSPGHGAFVENVRWEQSGVVFAAVHVVGSNNGLATWFDGVETPAQTAERLGEVNARTEASVAWVDAVFDRARDTNAAAVVLGMQADPWDPTSLVQGYSLAGSDRVTRQVAERAATFGNPVIWLQGDSHKFKVDRPLATGDALHEVTTLAPNVTRIVVEGETTAEWLKLTIESDGTMADVSWERMPLNI